MFVKLVNKKGELSEIPEITLGNFLSGCLVDCSSGAVYRGQSDAGWDLIPSGFRDETGRLASHAERNAKIRKFQSETFVGKCEELRELLREREEVRELKKSQFRHLQLLVIAQHFGVPTPLLDWTKSPLVAVYMATIFRKYPGSIGLFRLDRATHPEDLTYTDYSEVSFNRIQSQLGGVSCFGTLGNTGIQLTTDTFTEFFEHNRDKIISEEMDCFVSKVNVRIEDGDIANLNSILAANGITTENLFPRSGYWKAISIRDELLF